MLGIHVIDRKLHKEEDMQVIMKDRAQSSWIGLAKLLDSNS